eukprot:TRINITY_DN71069_c0_g1_i1.p1 TRINITY_DN71069_c0_g1~~TRINITY_DN71069_c0_g1_i1.p1  ORF type:complete len:566 (+),score=185.96 TRINITY_DN71069_c0_g1_i1:71-1699(+)
MPAAAGDETLQGEPPQAEGLPVARGPPCAGDPDSAHLARSGAAVLLHRAVERALDEKPADPIAFICSALRQRELPLDPSRLLHFVTESGSADLDVTMDILAVSSPPRLDPCSAAYGELHAAATAASDYIAADAVQSAGDEAAAQLGHRARKARPLLGLALRLGSAKAELSALAATCAAQATPPQTPAEASPERAKGRSAEAPLHLSVIIPVRSRDAARIRGGLLHRWAAQLRWLAAPLPGSSIGTPLVSWRLCVAEEDGSETGPSAAAAAQYVVSRCGGGKHVFVASGCGGRGGAIISGLAACEKAMPDEVSGERHYVVIGDASEAVDLAALVPLIGAVHTAPAPSGIAMAYAIPEPLPGPADPWPYAKSMPHKFAIALLRRLAPTPFLHDTGDCYTRMLAVKHAALAAANAVHGPLLCRCGPTTPLMELFGRLANQAERDKRKVPPFAPVLVHHGPPHASGLSPAPEVMSVPAWRQLAGSLVLESARKRREEAARWAEWLEICSDSMLAALYDQPSHSMVAAENDRSVRVSAALPLPQTTR